MSPHPFLKSIKPVNLLSFGPNTQEIELRPLNILIGPNGGGKSNLIEIIGLLSKLPDKDPWSDVIQTGGAREWIWKGKDANGGSPCLSVTTTGGEVGYRSVFGNVEKEPLYYWIALVASEGGFVVQDERFLEVGKGANTLLTGENSFERAGRSRGDDENTYLLVRLPNPQNLTPSIPANRSVLSALGSEPYFSTHHPRMRELSEAFDQFTFYRNWAFGQKSETRKLQPAGLESYRLSSDSINLAQVLKAMRDRGDSSVFDRLVELMRKFYESVKDVDTELVGTYLRIMIKEEGLSSRTPAERLSDGTLRWLMLLIILLDPAPPPVICIDEPELGLHPDAIHTLADLLVEASTRTQLIVTTHSTALVDAFSDDPETVCVCEKVDGSTVIKRLEKERLKVWLENYSLSHLWASGEIGGNRW